MVKHIRAQGVVADSQSQEPLWGAPGGAECDDGSGGGGRGIYRRCGGLVPSVVMRRASLVAATVVAGRGDAVLMARYFSCRVIAGRKDCTWLPGSGG